VVTVTHWSAAVIGTCLAAVGEGADVIVVDNASGDATLDIVGRGRPDARVLRNSVGIGFGNGANRGIAAADREFILLINPDATLKEGALDRLIAAADAYPDAGIVAPQIFSPAGEAVPCHDAGLFARRRMASRRQDPVPEGELCADYLSGAALLIRRRALDQVGVFDSRIFLYYEDDDLCLRLRRAGWSLVLAPDARAEHIGGGSIRAGWDKYWEKFWHMSWSRLYFEEKYLGRRAMLRVAAPALGRYAVKTALYALAFNRRKMTRDAARFCGSAAYLLGVPAMPAVQP
jgi:GT2 family glycosyltransferase